MGLFTKGLVLQRGSSLIEAMVAMLILAILFLGIAQVLGRGLVSQRYMNAYSLALLEMRERLQQHNDVTLCSNPGNLSWVGNIQLVARCDENDVTIGVNGANVSVKTNVLTLSTNGDEESQAFFGADGVIRISESSSIK